MHISAFIYTILSIYDKFIADVGNGVWCYPTTFWNLGYVVDIFTSASKTTLKVVHLFYQNFSCFIVSTQGFKKCGLGDIFVMILTLCIIIIAAISWLRPLISQLFHQGRSLERIQWNKSNFVKMDLQHCFWSTHAMQYHTVP